MNAYQDKRRTDDATIYLYSKCESLIEIYARSSSLSEAELRNRVGELLLSKEMREQLGSEDRLPALRGEATSNHTIRSAALAMARSSRSPAQVKRHYTVTPKARAARRRAAAHARAFRWPKTNPSRKGFSYEGKHWTQQPENKAKLRAQMKRTYAAVTKDRQLAQRRARDRKRKQQERAAARQDTNVRAVSE